RYSEDLDKPLGDIAIAIDQTRVQQLLKQHRIAVSLWMTYSMMSVSYTFWTNVSHFDFTSYLTDPIERTVRDMCDSLSTS
ncbi:hypothetical protein M9458_034209, partial [Cirrhinus mrigala]